MKQFAFFATIFCALSSFALDPADVGVYWQPENGFVSNTSNFGVSRSTKGSTRYDSIWGPAFDLNYESVNGIVQKKSTASYDGDEGVRVDIKKVGSSSVGCNFGSAKDDMNRGFLVQLMRSSMGNAYCSYADKPMCDKLIPLLKNNSGFKPEDFNKALKLYKQCSDALSNLEFSSEKILGILNDPGFKDRQKAAVSDAQAFASDASSKFKSKGGFGLDPGATGLPADHIAAMASRMKSGNGGSLSDAYNILQDIDALVKNCQSISAGTALAETNYRETNGKSVRPVDTSK